MKQFVIPARVSKYSINTDLESPPDLRSTPMVFHSTKFYLSRIINLKILSTNFIFLKIEPGVDQKAENRRKAEDFREVTRIE